jgi:hypothetical protein
LLEDACGVDQRAQSACYVFRAVIAAGVVKQVVAAGPPRLKVSSCLRPAGIGRSPVVALLPRLAMVLLIK